MSTILPSGASDPDPERTPDNSDYGPRHALGSDAVEADAPEETGTRKRNPWWVAAAVLAVALVLVQLAIYASRNNSDEDETEQEPAATAPQDPQAPQSEGAPASPAAGDDPAVPTEGGYVDPEGAQEVPYEAAPGQFVGIEGMAMSVGGDIAAVDPIQLTDTGTLIPPSDVSRLGWYSASAVPGAAGASGTSVITGHINYQGQGTGYAARFANMKPGDEFEIYIDGAPQTFRVSQAPYRLPKGSDFPPEVNDSTGPNRLVLITCGGQFVGGALGYADNIITVAEPVAPAAPEVP